MIISTITSGLGNQLFQYAIARQLTINNKTKLYFDLRFYKSEYSRKTDRHFKLDNFNIDYNEISPTMELMLKGSKLFPKQSFHPFFKAYKEQYFHFDPAILQSNPFFFFYIKGFWQSEKYFLGAAKIIRSELNFTNMHGSAFNKFKSQIEDAENPVSIHVRRGDYVDHPEFSNTFGFIGLEYYEKAIQIMKDEIPNTKFFVFTNDIKWVRENFKTKDFVFVNNTGANADLDDMHLMKLCKHNIIANSSFSWWGAWLNNNVHKIIIAPKKWFKNQPEWDTRDLLPSEWLKI